MRQPIHYCNSKFCETKDLVIHPHDLGFLRAYGVFDFAPVYQGTPFRLNDHLERLLASANHVGIDCPVTLFDLESLTSALLEQNSELTGGLRYILTGGSYHHNTLYPESKPQLLMLAEPSIEENPKEIRVTTTSVMRALPQVKTMNYLPAVLGMKKAKSLGFADALYINSKRELLEGMTSNLFFIKEGKLYTDNSEQIIKGVTRSVVLQVAKKHLEVELKAVTIDELNCCEEAFLCSSTKDLLPIVQIEAQKIGSGTEGFWTKHLRRDFVALRSEELQVLNAI